MTSMKKEANDIKTRTLTWFSDWFRLRRFVALFQRTAKGFQHVLSRTLTLPDPRTVSLCVSDLFEADKIIVRWVYNRSFPEEILCLQSGEDSFLPWSNKLASLSPILVDSMHLVGSRIKNAPVTDDAKHHVIRPADSPVSRLIIQKIYVETGHGGRDQVLFRLRQRYWGIHATSVCRQICKSCVSCRRHFGRTVQQQMADIPTDLLLLLRVCTRIGRVALLGGRSYTTEFSSLSIILMIFMYVSWSSLVSSEKISRAGRCPWGLCGWPGIQLGHALGSLCFFDMLCMLDFCGRFHSYF